MTTPEELPDTTGASADLPPGASRGRAAPEKATGPVPTAWHVAPDVLAAYVGRHLDAARASSVDQHLLACATCRTGITTNVAAVDRDGLALVWTDIIDEVDRPRKSIVERAMRLLGIPDHVARLLASTPALRLSWLVAVALTLLFAGVNAGRAGGSDDILLLLAPLMPLAGIATAYGRGVDPLFELVKSAPLPGSRLFLFRSLAVLATALPLALLASLVMPYEGWRAVAWLAPALGLTGLALALSTVVRPSVATAVAGGTWVLGLMALWWRSGLNGANPTVALGVLAPFAPAGQFFFVGVGLIGAAVFARRADRFDLPGPSHLELS